MLSVRDESQPRWGSTFGGVNEWTFPPGGVWQRAELLAVGAPVSVQCIRFIGSILFQIRFNNEVYIKR